MSEINTPNRPKGPSLPRFTSVLFPLLDRDRQNQANALVNRFRRKEIPQGDFLSALKNIAGGDNIKMALSQIQVQDSRTTSNQSESQVSIQQQNMPRVGPNQPQNALVFPPAPNQSAPKMPNVVHLARFGLNNQQGNLVSSQNPNQSHVWQTPQVAHQQRNMPLMEEQKKKLGYPVNLVSYRTPNQSAWQIPQVAVQQQTMPSSVQNKKLGHPDGQNNNLVSSRTPNPSAWQIPQVAVQKQTMPYAVQNKKLGHPDGQKNPMDNLVSSRPPNPSSWKMPQVAIQQQNMPSVVQNKKPGHQVDQTNNQVSYQPTQQLPQVNVAIQQRTLSQTNQLVSHQVGQKKPLDDLVSSQTPSTKRQKVSAVPDQSIEQLNDVTAVSGVNITEEEEQMFSGRKRDTSLEEASRRILQEEEERLFLEKIPLQKKLREMVPKCGLKGASKDVERCLSLAVEERLRGLIGNLIRLSKQRKDVKKFKHKTVVTSDVRNQLMQISRKHQQQQQTEAAEMVQKQKEVDCEKATEALKRKQEEDIRTNKANIAARAAAGGSDMLSRWKLMAEKAKQKTGDAGSGSQPEKLDVVRKVNTLKGSSEDQKEEEKRTSPTQGEPERDKGFGAQEPEGRSKISVKDVIAALERDPMMSKSNLIHRLYEKIPTN